MRIHSEQQRQAASATLRVVKEKLQEAQRLAEELEHRSDRDECPSPFAPASRSELDG